VITTSRTDPAASIARRSMGATLLERMGPNGTFVLTASANTLYFVFDEGWTTSPGTDVRLVTKVVAASALVLWVGVMYWGSMLPFIGNSF